MQGKIMTSTGGKDKARLRALSRIEQTEIEMACIAWRGISQLNLIVSRITHRGSPDMDAASMARLRPPSKRHRNKKQEPPGRSVV